MMVAEERLQALKSSLEADGYGLEVVEEGGRVAVRISATPRACADCLIPKPLMQAMLHDALGVSEESIDLAYPSEPGVRGAQERGPDPGTAEPSRAER
jgi:hypothetical protein